MPNQSLEVLITPSVTKSQVGEDEFEGYNIRALYIILQFLNKRIDLDVSTQYHLCRKSDLSYIASRRPSQSVLFNTL